MCIFNTTQQDTDWSAKMANEFECRPAVDLIIGGISGDRRYKNLFEYINFSLTKAK